MLAVAKHSDVICLYLRNSMDQLDASLRRETSLFTETIKSLFHSEKDLKPQIDSLLPIVFNLRIKALKWFSNGDLNLTELHGEVYSAFDKLIVDPRYRILGEGVQLALRRNLFVIKALLNDGAIRNPLPAESLSNLPEVNYQQFLAALTFNAPDEIAQKFVDWINASLYIELISFCAIIIYEEHLQVSDSQVKELSVLINKAGENYLNLFIEGKFINNRSYNLDVESEEDAELLKGMQQIMSTGNTFDFLNEEEELYTIADLKKVYNGKG